MEPISVVEGSRQQNATPEAVLSIRCTPLVQSVFYRQGSRIGALQVDPGKAWKTAP